jgi:hypothetical protein
MKREVSQLKHIPKGMTRFDLLGLFRAAYEYLLKSSLTEKCHHYV